MPPQIDLDFFETVIAYNCFKGNSEYIAAVSDYLDSRYFNNPDIRQIVGVINEFYKQHDTIPTPTEIKTRLATAELRTAFINTVNSFREVAGNYNETELLQNTETFFKKRMILRTCDDIIRQHSSTKGIDTDKVFAQLDEAHSITMLEDMGMDYFEAIDAHIESLKQTERFMPTGWKWLDEKLGGGWMEQGRALYVFSGVTNVGKSIFLGNVACNAVIEDKVVVLISLEMSEHVYAKRIDAQLSKIALSKLATETDQLKQFVTNFKKDRCKSKLIIKEFPPSTISSRHISAYIKKLIRRGVKPDIIIIDYLSLLEPVHVTGSSYTDVKKISEQVRALSYIFKCPVISATQLNRCLSTDSQVIDANGNSKDIIDLTVGEQILGSKGRYVTVRHIYPKQKQPCYKITTKSGRSVVCSAKHVFPTNGGKFASIETGLKIGNKLTCFNELQT